MAIALDTVLGNIKPLDGAKVRRYLAGATITPGAPVYISAASTVSEADASAVNTNACIGVALAPRNQGTAYAAGDMVDVVTYGPCQFVTGATAGAIVYVKDDVGEVSETTGTKTTIVGIAETATVVFVNPQIVSLS
jgi:hypothetical protein